VDSKAGPVGEGRLSANACWGVLGNLLYVGGRFLIIVLLTKYWPSREVGQIALALAIVTPISFLINMELRLVLVTDTRRQVSVQDCLGVLSVSNLLLLGVLAALWGAGGSRWSGQLPLAVLLVGLIRNAESWADVYLGVLQKNELMKRVAVSQAIKTAAVLGCAAVLAAARAPIVWMLVSWLVATVVAAWLYDSRQARRWSAVKVRWRRGAIAGLVRRAFPLGVFVTMTCLNARLSQYFIGYYLSEADVAYFAVMLNFVAGATAMQNGVNHAVLPRLARYHADKVGAFWKLLVTVLGLCWLGGAMLFAAVWWKAPGILTVLYSAEYARHSGVFVVVGAAVAPVLTSMVLGDAVVACGKYKSRMFAVALGLAVNAALCWTMVGRYGLYGAAWAAVASSAVISLVCAVVLLVGRRASDSRCTLNAGGLKRRCMKAPACEAQMVAAVCSLGSAGWRSAPDCLLDLPVDPDRAPVLAAHGAVVEVGQVLVVVHFPGGLGIEGQGEVPVPVEIGSRLAELVVALAGAFDSEGDIGGVGGDPVGHDTLADVVLGGQTQVLTRRNVAEKGRAVIGRGRGADGAGDVVVAGRDVGDERSEDVEWGTVAYLLLKLHVFFDLVERDVAGALDDDLAALIPGAPGQLAECTELSQLGFVGGIGEAAGPQTVAE